jgi:uncharacterized membrane protein YphA (DoxX/SURF4 family)
MGARLIHGTLREGSETYQFSNARSEDMETTEKAERESRNLQGSSSANQRNQPATVRESTNRENTFALAALRIAIGCLFLIFGQYKVFGSEFTRHGGFQWWINRFLEDGGAYPFMIPVLERIVLQHATAVAFLVAYGELAIGIGLVLGACVRIASAFGVIYMLTLLLSSNYPGAHVPLWQYFGASLDHSVLALCFLTFIVSRSDAAFSIRKYLPKRAS